MTTDGSGDAPSQRGVAIFEDFSSADGAATTFVNDETFQTSGPMHTKAWPVGHRVFDPERTGPFPVGQLRVSVTEDDTLNGPDGKPGVLRLTFDRVPRDGSQAAFVFAGNLSRSPLSFPNWIAHRVTRQELARTFISFRFRADDQRRPNDYGVTMEVRIEPVGDDGKEHRADFGPLHATTNWRRMKRPLSTAGNLEEFLGAVNQDGVDAFLLVWGQFGPVFGYSPGDTLLIDDIRITYE